MGILGPEDRYIFIHIPKTAGMSITAALAQAGGIKFSDDEELRSAITAQSGFAGIGRGKKNVDHASAHILRKTIGTDRFDAMESVAVTRCPWDRLQSLYSYHRQRPRERLAAVIAEIIDLPFSAFVVELCERTQPRSTLDYLTDPQGKMLVDTVLRFENLERDFARWTDDILGESLMLPRLNRSRRETETYHDDAIAAVRIWFAKDMARFGYSDQPDGPVRTDMPS